MKIIDKVCEKIGLTDPGDKGSDNREKDMFVNEEEKRFLNENSASSNNVVNLHASSSVKENVAAYKMKVIVIEPKSFDDAQQVANCLKEKRPVVINFENTDEEAAKRIIDFVSGTTYALSGEIKKVGRNVFLCAPSNVNVSYTQEHKTVSTEMPWLKQED
jgi:cell division inhibitor SepF